MVKRDAGGKKDKLLWCKRIFDRIKGNLAEIQLKKHQNVPKTHFLQKVPGVNGLTDVFLEKGAGSLEPGAEKDGCFRRLSMTSSFHSP